MKVKTSELSGAALNWAAAIADGKKPRLQRNDDGSLFPQPVYDEYVWQLDYSAWGRAGPIIEREQINLDQFKGYPCRAHLGTHVQYEHAMFAPEGQPLVAAMRCFVASKLGDEVEVPEVLT